MTDYLFDRLDIRRAGAPGTEEHIEFGPDSGYEGCAPVACAIRVAVASARR